MTHSWSRLTTPMFCVSIRSDMGGVRLTRITDDPNSTTSEVLALLTLFPILLFVSCPWTVGTLLRVLQASYAALILVTREWTIIVMLLGQLSNELLNTVIKEFLRIERPKCECQATTRRPQLLNSLQWIWGKDMDSHHRIASTWGSLRPSSCCISPTDTHFPAMDLDW